MRVDIAKFRKSKLFRDIVTLVSGTTMAQVVPILLQPLLRRQYSPSDFGAYAVYLSLIGILITISSGRYENAIVLPKRDKEAHNILFLAQLINVGFLIFSLLAVVFFKSYLLNLLNLDSGYQWHLYLLPFGVFLFNLYQSLHFYLIRKKQYFSVSLNKLIRRISEGAGQVGFGLFFRSSGLLLGDIFGHLFNVSSGLYQCVVKTKFSIQGITINSIKSAASKYAEFPKFNMLPSFLSACSYLLPIILINKFYDNQVAGVFDLSKLLLSIPLALIATSISSIVLQRSSEHIRENKSLKEFIRPLFFAVLAISVVEIVAIQLFGVRLFVLLFGAEWAYSGELSKQLVWIFSLNFITSCFSSLFIATRRVKLMSVWQFMYFAGIVFLIAFRNLPFSNFIQVYIAIEIAMNILAIFLIVSVYVIYEKSLENTIESNNEK